MKEFYPTYLISGEEKKPLTQESKENRNPIGERKSNESKGGKEEVEVKEPLIAPQNKYNIQNSESKFSTGSEQQLQSIGDFNRPANTTDVASAFIPIALLAFMAKASLMQEEKEKKEEEKVKVQPIVYNIYNTNYQADSIAIKRADEVNIENMFNSSTKYISTEKRKETNLKILIVGDVSVGKSTLLRLFSGKGEFSPNYKATIGVDFALKTIPLSPDEVLQVQLWDIGNHT